MIEPTPTAVDPLEKITVDTDYSTWEYLDMTPEDGERYEGDLRGLLQARGYPLELMMAIVALNNLESSTDYDGRIIKVLPKELVEDARMMERRRKI